MNILKSILNVLSIQEKYYLRELHNKIDIAKGVKIAKSNEASYGDGTN